MRRCALLVRCLLLVCLGVLARAQAPEPAPAFVSLTDYGPIATPAQADAALAKAAAALIAGGGGILLIPADAPAGWQPENISQGAWRKPDPPAPAKQWGYTAGITIVDARGGTMTISVPQMTPLTFERTLRMAEGQSAGHWGYLPMAQLNNSLIRGTTSYHDWVVEGVKAGKARRIYVHTIRGLFPGMFVNTLGGNMNRLYIQALGYDAARHLPYVVADVDADIADGALLSNKTHANVLRMDTYSHTENQTFDAMLMRHNYSQGDNYMYYAGFRYMGDVHSTAGDENGVLYAAFPMSMTNIFRGTVETFNPQTAELKYTGATNAHTLASGRPIINMNPAKWITAGSAHIIHPGGALIGYAGGVRSYDAPWTKDVVGRYIAIDEADEYVPGSDRVRRWYYIAGFSEKDGLKSLSIQRNWWGAKNGSSITRLYNPAHYTLGAEQKDAKPLKYIIAPGANVYDVARGVRDDGPWGGQYVNGAFDRVVKVSPGPHLGTAFDFAPGDPIEQAMGPDPFKPIPFRSWLFENVPGAFPAPVLDVANHGDTMRDAVLTVDGGSGRYADYRDPAKPLPQLPWNKVIEVQSACNEGIAFAADTGDAAIAFRQPGPPQLMKWSGSEWSNPQGILGVSNSGDFELWWQPRGYKGEAGGVDVAGAELTAVRGLAGNKPAGFNAAGAGKAANFRGVQAPVPAGAMNFTVTFPTAEKDGMYTVTVSPSWMTAHAVTERTTTGFTVQFNRPAPAKATVDWVLVR